MAHLVYVQSTGRGYSSTSTNRNALFEAYSGKGEHKNKPDSQCITDLGPIQTGWYEMKLLKTHLGMKNVISLTPNAENEMYGRSGFLIQGDSVADPGVASNGCIIVNDSEKRAELASSFKELNVISYNISPLLANDRRMLDSAVSTSDASEDDISVTALEIPFFLGAGFRSYSMEFGRRILNHNAVTEPGQPEDARVESKFGILMSQEDFESAISVDAAISSSYGAFSANAKANLRQLYSRSQTSVSIAFTRKVVAGVFRVAQYPILEAAAKEAQDPVRFLRVYGDSLITGVGMGGSCCYIFRFDFQSETEAKEFSLSIGARYGSGSGSLSREERKKLTKIRSSVLFSGYTTGTIEVPDLFPSGIMEGTDFLFGKDFSARMISGLLDYYDLFPSKFRMGVVQSGYSQCDQEDEPLSNLPKALENQDQIARLGDRMKAIATSLRRQRDYLEALDAQVAYIQTVKDCNIEKAISRSSDIRDAVIKLIDKIDARLNRLIADGDLDNPFDFRRQFPTIDEYLCTADPELRQAQFTCPRGRWAYHDFQITPSDYGKTCWIKASANICAVGHRPNGGTLQLALYEVPLDDLPQQSMTAFGVESPEVDKGAIFREVDKYTATVTRGKTASAEVGGFAFVPVERGAIYRIGVRTDGNYRCGSHVRLSTKIARQSTILF